MSIVIVFDGQSIASLVVSIDACLDEGDNVFRDFLWVENLSDEGWEWINWDHPSLERR